MQRAMKVIVFGASGFIGRSLIPRLIQAGHWVRGASRQVRPAHDSVGANEWVACDVRQPSSLTSALEGVDAAYYLVHSMGADSGDEYPRIEREGAESFAEAAKIARLSRIVYLGGVEPKTEPSKHLASRLQVGRILRESAVPTLELRASMIIGNGSTSWQIVRDLAMRLPVMVFPAWLESRTSAVAVEDVLVGLVAGLSVHLDSSTWYDLSGTETLSAREILIRIAAVRGRRLPGFTVPVLSPRLSARWLKFVTGADLTVAKELIQGLSHDLIPQREGYWDLIGHHHRMGFDDAVRSALRDEHLRLKLRPLLGALEEKWVSRFAPKLKRRR